LCLIGGFDTIQGMGTGLNGPAHFRSGFKISMNTCFVIQSGRLQYEGLLLAESILYKNVLPPSSVHIYYPVNSSVWAENPEPDEDVLEFLKDRGFNLVAFENRHFGSAYPISNKIYAVNKAAQTSPHVLFLDTDSLFVGDAAASFLDDRIVRDMGNVGVCKAGGSFPQAHAVYSKDAIWRAIYRKFGIDPDDVLSAAVNFTGVVTFPYFNAGTVFFSNSGPVSELWLRVALEINKRDLPELEGQKIFPFLDQIALPVAIALSKTGYEYIHSGFNCNQLRGDIVHWHYHYPYIIYEALTSFEGGAVLDDLRTFFGDYLKRSVSRDLIFKHKSLGYFLDENNWPEISKIYREYLSGTSDLQRRVFWKSQGMHRIF